METIKWNGEKDRKIGIRIKNDKKKYERILGRFLG
jgi:hypothetical protein